MEILENKKWEEVDEEEVDVEELPLQGRRRNNITTGAVLEVKPENGAGEAADEKHIAAGDEEEVEGAFGKSVCLDKDNDTKFFDEFPGMQFASAELSISDPNDGDQELNVTIKSNKDQELDVSNKNYGNQELDVSYKSNVDQELDVTKKSTRDQESEVPKQSNGDQDLDVMNKSDGNQLDFTNVIIGDQNIVVSENVNGDQELKIPENNVGSDDSPSTPIKSHTEDKLEAENSSSSSLPSITSWESHNPIFQPYSNAIFGNEDIILINENDQESHVEKESDQQLLDIDVERVLQKQETHDLYCPNCNSCITKRVILRKRKRIGQNAEHKVKRDKFEMTGASEINANPARLTNIEGLGLNVTLDESSTVAVNYNHDGEPDVFRCLSCFSFFVPKGTGFKLFRIFGVRSGGEDMPSPQKISPANIDQSLHLPIDNEKVASDWVLPPMNQFEAHPVHSQRQVLHTLEHMNPSIHHKIMQSSHGSVHPLAGVLEKSAMSTVVSVPEAQPINLPAHLHSYSYQHHTETKDKPDEAFRNMTKNKLSSHGTDHLVAGVLEKKPMSIVPSVLEARQTEAKNKPDEAVKNMTISSGDTHSESNVEAPVSANLFQIPGHATDGTTKLNKAEEESFVSTTQGSTLLKEMVTDVEKRSDDVIEKITGIPLVSTIASALEVRHAGTNNRPDTVVGNKMISAQDSDCPLTVEAPLSVNLFQIPEIATGGRSKLNKAEEHSVVLTVQGSILLQKLVTDVEKTSGATIEKVKEDVIINVETGPITEVASPRAENLVVSEETTVLLESGTQTYESRENAIEVKEVREWDILKSIVYGGLAESIASLGIVLSAAGANTSTVSVLALGLANLIGGLFIIFHNLRELKNDHSGGASNENTEQVDRYKESLGRRENFKRHAIVAVLSFIIFGLLPPVIYAFSFLKSDDRYFKSIVVLAASLLCIVLLALGKAHSKSQPKSYFKTVFYFVSMAIVASGVSFIAGSLIKKLIEKLRLFETSSSIYMPFPEAASNDSWASY